MSENDVSAQGPAKPIRRRAEKARKFYLMWADYRGTLGLELENVDKIGRHGIFVLQDARVRGIPDLVERPRFRHRRSEGRLPRDFEIYSDWWLVSDAMKTVLETTDLEAFQFVRCDLVLENGDPGPALWLCDVLPIVDAVDESNSDVGIILREDRKIYTLMGSRRLVIDPLRVGNENLFRMKYLEQRVICDDVFHRICKQHSLKGIQFRATPNI